MANLVNICSVAQLEPALWTRLTLKGVLGGVTVMGQGPTFHMSSLEEIRHWSTSRLTVLREGKGMAWTFLNAILSSVSWHFWGYAVSARWPVMCVGERLSQNRAPGSRWLLVSWVQPPRSCPFHFSSPTETCVSPAPTSEKAPYKGPLERTMSDIQGELPWSSGELTHPELCPTTYWAPRGCSAHEAPPNRTVQRAAWWLGTRLHQTFFF